MAARVIIVLVILGRALAAQNDDAADKATFQKVCGACHTTTIVSDLKTESEWIETVDNMTSVGAKGTDEQFAAVLRYLSHNFTKVNVNTAPPEQIAPALGLSDQAAQALVAYRTQHGNFATLEDVKKVPGIDAAKIDARKNKIAFR